LIAEGLLMLCAAIGLVSSLKQSFA
jgi:hypothetical protein